MDAQEEHEEFITPRWAGGDRLSAELRNFPRPNVKSISWKCSPAVSRAIWEVQHPPGTALPAIIWAAAF